MAARVMLLLTGAIMVAVLAGGCGSGDSSTAGEHPTSGVKTTSLSKAQFVRRASALCRRLANDKFVKTEAYLERQSAHGVSRPVLLADAAKAVLMPIAEARIAGIRKLGAPAGDEAEIEAMLAGQEEGIEQVKMLKEFVEGESLVPYFAESNKLFESYGLSAGKYDL